MRAAASIERMFASTGLAERPLGALPDDDGASVDTCAPWESLAGVEDVAPGGDLALTLELVEITSADDRMLVETVAAWERLAAWAHLGATLTAAELSRRSSMNPDWDAPAPADRCVAGDELAMRLSWSRRAANRLVRDGRALENELLLVAEAVRDGRLDTPKLHVMTDRLHDRPGELAWAVQQAVLPGAATRTPTQLAADVDRALLAVEPRDTADRLARANEKRHVCRPTRLPDGMAGLWAVLPAPDAVRIDATLEATARSARALGDPRSLDQLRADTLVDLATGAALLAGARPDETALPQIEARVDGGASPSATQTSDEVAGGASDLQRPRSDEEGASASDLQTPGSDEEGASASGLATSPSGRGPDGVGGEPADGARRRAPAVRIPRVSIDVTVALSTLMALDDDPAELAGFGPIGAEQARALAAGGTWRRLVTDPLTGQVLDVGRTRYRPPQGLADHVAARDRVCVSPGCSVPAQRCDLDHTTEFHGTPANGSAMPGTTSAHNLGPLSDRCHRLKTDGGFILRQVAPGMFEWRTPAGLGYRVVPGDHGRTERLGVPSWPRPGYPEEPPF